MADNAAPEHLLIAAAEAAEAAEAVEGAEFGHKQAAYRDYRLADAFGARLDLVGVVTVRHLVKSLALAARLHAKRQAEHTRAHSSEVTRAGSVPRARPSPGTSCTGAPAGMLTCTVDLCSGDVGITDVPSCVQERISHMR